MKNGIDRNAMNRRLFRIVLVRSHAKGAAGNQRPCPDARHFPGLVPHGIGRRSVPCSSLRLLMAWSGMRLGWIVNRTGNGMADADQVELLRRHHPPLRPRLSVAGRIRIITASRAGGVARRGRRCVRVRRSICRRSVLPPHRLRRRHTSRRGTPCAGRRRQRTWRHRPADDVDEEGCTAIAAGEIAFEDLNIERQFIPFELWRFQNDDSILYGAILAKDGDRGVRRVLGKAVIARTPVRDDIRGELVAG